MTWFRIECWLYEMLMLRDTWALEFYLAVQSLFFGTFLAGPGQVGLAADNMTLLAMLPEWMWGVIFAVHGAAHLKAMYSQRVQWCRLAMLTLAGLWCVILTSFLLSHPFNAAIIVWGAQMLACLWIYVRLHHLHLSR